MYNYSKYLSRFDNYRWQLRALSAKETEYRKINSDINSGVTARDVFDPDWKKTLQSEIEALKAELAKPNTCLRCFQTQANTYNAGCFYGFTISSVAV